MAEQGSSSQKLASNDLWTGVCNQAAVNNRKIELKIKKKSQEKSTTSPHHTNASRRTYCRNHHAWLWPEHIPPALGVFLTWPVRPVVFHRLPHPWVDRTPPVLSHWLHVQLHSSARRSHKATCSDFTHGALSLRSRLPPCWPAPIFSV